MKQLDTHLTSLGLSPSEASIYLAGLQRTSSGVHELSHLTGMKRPTVYHALHLLEQKGLATKKGMGRRLVYVMQSPERLRDTLQEQAQALEAKRETLEALIPLLVRPASGLSAATQVQHVETIEGMKTLVDEALYCKSRRWDIIAPKRNFFSEMDPAYAKTFMTARQGREIRTRSLWERPDKTLSTDRRLTEQEIQQRNPRYLPDIFRGRFTSTMLLFDDKTLFLSSFQDCHGVFIQSQEVHDLLTTLFEGMWLSSEPYEHVA